MRCENHGHMLCAETSRMRVGADLVSAAQVRSCGAGPRCQILPQPGNDLVWHDERGRRAAYEATDANNDAGS